MTSESGGVGTRTDLRTVAVVGTGVIGSSWAAQFLARGLDVVAVDPGDRAEDRLREYVQRVWPTLRELGLAPGADPGRLRFSTDAGAAAAESDLVQENAPERLELKRSVIRELDAAAAPDVVIASSTSGLMPSLLQAGATRHPERVVVGHVFNPPHLIPLVEVVGGKLTSTTTVDSAMAIYRALGKKPIRVSRELPGHVANRLQAALWREAYSLIDRGAVSAEDLDAAISHGPGLRWALLGPLLTMHLSGGAGGLRHVLEHLGPPMQDWWDDLGTPLLDERLTETVLEAVGDELAGLDIGAAERDRDRILVQLLAAKSAAAHLP